MPKPTLNRKPLIAIIGPGRLGTALAISLVRRGYKIEALVGTRRSQMKRSASLLDVPVHLLAAKEVHLLKTPDLVIISTPDDQIASVAERLLGLIREKVHPPTALHTSGALSSEVLFKLAKKGWSTGSIHPLVSVSDPVTGADSLRGAFWCIEGDRRAIRQSGRLVRDLEGKSFAISATAKPLYHAAAVMSSGGVVSLFSLATQMLTKCGLKPEESRRILLPLLESTVANLRTQRHAKALTGPFARGDFLTIERHLTALSAEDLSTARKVYRLLGGESLQLAKDNGLDPGVAARIQKALDG